MSAQELRLSPFDDHLRASPAPQADAAHALERPVTAVRTVPPGLVAPRAPAAAVPVQPGRRRRSRPGLYGPRRPADIVPFTLSQLTWALLVIAFAALALSSLPRDEPAAKPTTAPAKSPTRVPTGRIALPTVKRVAPKPPAAVPVKHRPARARKARPAPRRRPAARAKTPRPAARAPAPQPASSFSQEFAP